MQLHKRFGAVALMVAGLASQALAQQQDPGGLPVLVEITEGSHAVPRLNVTVDELEDMTIYDQRGEVVGEIDDTLGTADGDILAVTLDVGGFLGLTDKTVVVPLDRVEVQGLRLTLNMTREQIEALPEWADQ